MPPKSANGFTLLELLISLTLLSVIMVLVFGAMRLGVRTWERGEALAEAQQHYRVVLQLIRRQVSGLYAPVRGVDRMVPDLFRGEADSMVFFSRVSLAPGTAGGLVYVEYRVEPDSEGGRTLRFREKAVSGKLAGVGAVEGIPEAAHELFSDAETLYFEYLAAPARMASREGPAPFTDNWRNSWDYEAEGVLPRAVRVHLRLREGDPAIRVVIPCRREKPQNAA